MIKTAAIDLKLQADDGFVLKVRYAHIIIWDHFNQQVLSTNLINKEKNATKMRQESPFSPFEIILSF